MKFIKRDVTKEINKLFERNMQNVKEISKDYTYNKYRKKSTVSYVILGIGAILLLYFSSRISSAGFKANLPFFHYRTFVYYLRSCWYVLLYL